MNREMQHYHLRHVYETADRDTEFALLNFNELQSLFGHTGHTEAAHPHKHSFYVIAWVDNGWCSQVVDKQTYELSKNHLFFVYPGQNHENDFSYSKDFSGGALLLSLSYFSALRDHQNTLLELTFVDNAFLNPQLELKSEAFQTIRHTIALIASEYHHHTQPHELLFQSLLVTLLLQIQRHIDNKLLQSVPRHSLILYKQFKRLVELHYQEAKSIPDYAASLHVTPRHLHRVIKESSGKTPSEILRNRAILEAKRMLTLSDKSIAEIAYSLGFSDDSYFNKVFKKEVGVTPLAFQKANVRILP